MHMTRRKVLRLGALAAASAAAPLGAISILTGTAAGTTPFSPTKKDYDALARMTADTFKPWVGSVFDVYSGAPRPTLVVLTEVNLLPPGTSSQSYSLRFQSLPAAALPQGTYVFKDNALGRFALFVVPSKAGTHPTYYTGTVNRATQ
jgi:hypothetical protein